VFVSDPLPEYDRIVRKPEYVFFDTVGCVNACPNTSSALSCTAQRHDLHPARNDPVSCCR